MDSFNQEVLVIDDNAPMRRVLINILRKYGFKHFQEAENGDSALKKLQERAIGLALIDWNMPGINGLEVLKIIRQTPEIKELPVIMVTAESIPSVISMAIRAGVNGYVAKPFTPEEIHRQLDNLFKKPLESKSV